MTAFRFGALTAAAALFYLVTRPVPGACVPLPGQPGATVCGGRVDRGLIAFAAAPEPTIETIVADPLPTVDTDAPLPPWMPAGVLIHEVTIRQAARELGLDPLALAILAAIECPSGNAACTSYVGARGLAQVMPATGATIEAATGYPCSSQAHDPLTSLRCGGWYYVQCLRAAAPLWADGREVDAIGAAGSGYNGGPGFIPAIVRHVQAGGAVCEAPVPAESRRWCSMATDMWRKAGRQ
jgi:hypothetical protein